MNDSLDDHPIHIHINEFAVTKIDGLRRDINAIVAEIEGGKA